jgi:outer membrane lipoprotein SlyB
MKHLIRLGLVVLLALEMVSCVAPHPSPVIRGRRRGGVAGAAIGGAVGGWEGAAAGALIGGTAGGMAGRARRSYYTGTPYYAPARSYRGMGYY